MYELNLNHASIFRIFLFDIPFSVSAKHFLDNEYLATGVRMAMGIVSELSKSFHKFWTAGYLSPQGLQS